MTVIVTTEGQDVPDAAGKVLMLEDAVGVVALDEVISDEVVEEVMLDGSMLDEDVVKVEEVIVVAGIDPRETKMAYELLVPAECLDISPASA